MRQKLTFQGGDIKISEGEITADMAAMDRILAWDFKKLWKHRISVLWREFGTGITIAGYVSISALTIGFLLNATNADRFCKIVLTVLFTFPLTGALLLITEIYLTAKQEFINGPLKRIKKAWNGNNLSERLLEKQKHEK